jgi:hypothetical protein
MDLQYEKKHLMFGNEFSFSPPSLPQSRCDTCMVASHTLLFHTHMQLSPSSTWHESQILNYNLKK